MRIKHIFHSFWGGLIIGIIILVIGFFVWSLINRGGVNFSILGPDNIASGNISNFTFKYVNNSRVALEDCSLDITLPEGVVFTENPLKKTMSIYLGEVLAQTSGEKTLSLMITGEPQTAKIIEATFNYRPKGISSSFAKKDSKTVLLTGSIFNLNINLPQKVFIGQDFPLEINWSNLTNQSFANAELRAEWPSGFSLISANPDVTKEQGTNNTWLIGNIVPTGQGAIKVQSSLSGQDGETKRIALTLGINQNGSFLPLVSAQGFVTLLSNPLKLSVFVNGDTDFNADLGDKLDFTVNYENNYSASLRDLVLTVQFKGDAFDFSTLKAPNAVFSSRLQTLTWTGSRVSSLYVLNPGAKGTLNFSVKLKSDWPMQSLAQKNIVLEIDSNIKSSSVPEELGYQALPQASTINTVKLNSFCLLDIGSYFRDPPALIVNTGKLPLKVDQPIDFTIHWKIVNTYNAINNVTVETTLPLWAEWTNQVAGNYGSSAPLYDAHTRKISWTIPVVPAGSGTLITPYEAVFQIKVTPLSSQINQSIELTNETTFTATDSFTLKNINLVYPKVLSDKLTDTTVIPNEGIVRP
ncbi:MAG: hypothetical protein GYA31_00470 [Parcubacteria group bacterium]|nr:hypothetical protein [Parcubacteria group bacterium]